MVVCDDTGGSPQSAGPGMGFDSLMGRALEETHCLAQSNYTQEPPDAMTPTPTLLLFVALFWTLPASAAAYLYRTNGNSFKNLRSAVQAQLVHVTNGIEEHQCEPQTAEA